MIPFRVLLAFSLVFISGVVSAANNVAVTDPNQLFTTYYYVPEQTALPAPSGVVTKDIVQASTTQSYPRTTNNPQAYQPKLLNGAAVVQSTMMIEAPATINARLVSAPVSAAADAMGGVHPSSAPLVRTIPLGSGSGSTAAVMGAGLLVGAKFIPWVGTALTVATVGMAGYDLYNSLKGQGITVAPDGFVTGSSFLWYRYGGAGSASTPDGACALYNDGVYTYFSGGGSNPAAGLDGQNCVYRYYTWPAGQTVIGGSIYKASSGTAPLDSAGVQNALITATATATAAVDIARLALEVANRPLPANLPVSSSPTTLASPWGELTTKTDSQGNVTQTLQRNVTTINSGSTNNSTTNYTTNQQTVTVVNSAPQSVVSNPISPVVAAPLPGLPDPSKDLCLLHPEILACANITSLNDVAAQPLTNKDIQLGTLTPVPMGASVAVCPPPLTIPGMLGGPPIVLSFWQPACDFAGSIKAINIAAAGLFSMFILIGGFKNG